MKSLVPPVVRDGHFTCLPFFLTCLAALFQYCRHFLLSLLLRHAVSPVFPMPCSGYGFTLYSLGSRIRRSHIRLQKTSLIILIVQFRRAVLLFELHAPYAG